MIRKRMIALALGLFCVLVCVAAAPADETNLITNPGVESAIDFDWVAYGTRTVTRRVATGPHGGEACLFVSDDGPQGGQANNPFFAAAPGFYYVEGWLRTDPAQAQKAVLDVQFFGEGRRYMSGAVVGSTSSSAWTRVASFVVVPERTVTVRLRVMPTPLGNGPLRGACFADDFYMASVEAVKRAGRIRIEHEMKPCQNEDPEGRVGAPPPDLAGKARPSRGQLDFEDLSGWTLEVFGDVNASFSRSREQPLWGGFAGRLSVAGEGGSGFAVLRPPAPVPVGGRFEAVQLWCYGDPTTFRAQSVPHVAVIIEEDGARRAVSLPAVNWPFWSIAHQRLDEPTLPSARIVELQITQLSAQKGRPRTFFFDELRFHNESMAPLELAVPDVPCPTPGGTIRPQPRADFVNTVEQDGAVWRLSCRGKGETLRYKYAPATGTLEDLTVAVAGGPGFRPAAGGGPVFELGGATYGPGAEGLGATLTACDRDKDAVRAVWRYEAGGETVVVEWRLRVKGKSLILTVDAPGRNVAKWLFGKPGGVESRPVHVPYLTRHCGAAPVWVAGERCFVHCQPDWYVTHAAAFREDHVEYGKAFGGERPALHERLFLTVSSDFGEVLPNIPNPKSPFAHVLGGNVYTNMSGGLSGEAFERCLELWRQMKSLGLEKVIVKHHATTWSEHCGRGNEPFVQTLRAAGNIPGGDAALARYIAAVKRLGYEYFLYTDYCIVSPVNAHFEEPLVALNSDGKWTRGWIQYYSLTPLMAPVLAAKLAPALKAKYGLTGSYCDQHTAPAPSRWVDYDPRKPGAAMLQTVFRAYCKVFEIEKQAYGGPVVSEGGNYWIYAGMVDGNYAQLIPPRGKLRWETPFLVDFDLLKIHPLQVDLGMGWRGSYGYDAEARDPGAALDRFLCATIAFGHSGVLYTPNFPNTGAIKTEDPLGAWKRSAVRTYFMIQGLARRYALTPVRSIRYWDGSRLLDTSAAVLAGAHRESQVAVEYENGLRVWANGSFARNWRVTANGATFELPPNGWLAVHGDDFLEYSALRDGRRVDYVRSPVYTFADGRGALTDFGDVQSQHATIILHTRGEERHVVDTAMGR